MHGYGCDRAGVEKVMGFGTDCEYEESFRSVPQFGRMLVRSGIQLFKYWFSIPDGEQEACFLAHIQEAVGARQARLSCIRYLHSAKVPYHDVELPAKPTSLKNMQWA